MEVRLLGPVVLCHAGHEVAMIRMQTRCVLAALAMNPGQAVSSQSLVDCVWGEHPPPSAIHSLHAHVSRLRQAMARAGGGSAQLLRSGDGYLLDIDHDQVDLHRSRRLAAAARAITGGQPAPDQQVTQLLRQACALWRGTPLSGLAGGWAARVRDGLAQERLTMLVERYRAELRLGEHAAVIGPVSALLAEHPQAEPLAAVQMLALYRCGQQADALEVYARIRQWLVEEIGDEPGPELRALHEQLLRRDPRLDLRPEPAQPPLPQPVRTALAQLPTDVPAFTGRAEQLSYLDAMLPDRADQPKAVGIAVLAGPAGVGKTALAVHWAHRVRWRFPAGQLYANLRGFGPDPPVTPEEVLAQFLRALGVPPGDVPADLDEAAARYRSLLADQRMLVVLDNARHVGQVRPLVPGGSGCFVLVTSRNHLPELVAHDGAQRLRLDVFRPDESYALLSGLLGAERVAAERVDVAALAERCGHVPLALRIAAANRSAGAAGPAPAGRHQPEPGRPDGPALPATTPPSRRYASLTRSPAGSTASAGQTRSATDPDGAGVPDREAVPREAAGPGAGAGPDGGVAGTMGAAVARSARSAASRQSSTEPAPSRSRRLNRTPSSWSSAVTSLAASIDEPPSANQPPSSPSRSTYRRASATARLPAVGVGPIVRPPPLSSPDADRYTPSERLWKADSGHYRPGAPSSRPSPAGSPPPGRPSTAAPPLVIGSTPQAWSRKASRSALSVSRWCWVEP
jgi:DNA-binding SARP family transcriptional activator